MISHDTMDPSLDIMRHLVIPRSITCYHVISRECDNRTVSVISLQFEFLQFYNIYIVSINTSYINYNKLGIPTFFKLSSIQKLF